ncbi:hypothetical protein ACA910_015638 [Epithemia clementina (nom. ined.)]
MEAGSFHHPYTPTTAASSSDSSSVDNSYSQVPSAVSSSMSVSSGDQEVTEYQKATEEQQSQRPPAPTSFQKEDFEEQPIPFRHKRKQPFFLHRSRYVPKHFEKNSNIGLMKNGVMTTTTPCNKNEQDLESPSPSFLHGSRTLNTCPMSYNCGTKKDENGNAKIPKQPLLVTPQYPFRAVRKMRLWDSFAFESNKKARLLQPIPLKPCEVRPIALPCPVYKNAKVLRGKTLVESDPEMNNGRLREDDSSDDHFDVQHHRGHNSSRMEMPQIVTVKDNSPEKAQPSRNDDDDDDSSICSTPEQGGGHAKDIVVNAGLDTRRRRNKPPSDHHTVHSDYNSTTDDEDDNDDDDDDAQPSSVPAEIFVSLEATTFAKRSFFGTNNHRVSCDYCDTQLWSPIPPTTIDIPISLGGGGGRGGVVHQGLAFQTSAVEGTDGNTMDRHDNDNHEPVHSQQQQQQQLSENPSRHNDPRNLSKDRNLFSPLPFLDYHVDIINP